MASQPASCLLCPPLSWRTAAALQPDRIAELAQQHGVDSLRRHTASQLGNTPPPALAMRPPLPLDSNARDPLLELRDLVNGGNLALVGRARLLPCPPPLAWHGLRRLIAPWGCVCVCVCVCGEAQALHRTTQFIVAHGDRFPTPMLMQVRKPAQETAQSASCSAGWGPSLTGALAVGHAVAGLARPGDRHAPLQAGGDPGIRAGFVWYRILLLPPLWSMRAATSPSAAWVGLGMVQAVGIGRTSSCSSTLSFTRGARVPWSPSPCV